MSTFTVGLIALVVTLIGVYLGFTKSIPFRHHYDGQGRVQEREQPAPGVAGADRRRRGRQGHEDRARARGRQRRDRDDADPGQGPPAAHRRAVQDPPAHLPRGQLLRRRHARHAVGARRSTDGHDFPVNQTATPVQLDQVADRAAVRHARGPQDPAARVRARRSRARARKGFNRSIKYWKPAYRDSAIVVRGDAAARRSTTSPATSTAAASIAGALDRNRESAQVPDHDFNTTAGAFAREDTNLEAAIAELPRTLRAAQPALGALNELVPAACAASRTTAPGRRRTPAPTIDVALPLHHAAARPRLRARAARPRPPTCARPCPTLAQLAERERAAQPQVRRVGELPERGHPALEQGHGRRTRSSRRPGPVYQELPEAASRASPARAARATPTASGSACSPPAARTSSPSATACSARRALPLLGANPPKPTKRPPLDENVPCETQQTPDLRSTARRRRRSSTRSTRTRPAVQGPLGEGRASTAIECCMKQSLKREGLADKFEGLRQGPRRSALLKKLGEGRDASDRDQEAPRQLRGHHRADR